MAAGADTEAREGTDNTALHDAACCDENPAVIKALLDEGAHLEARAYPGRADRPLDAAGGNRNPAVIESLLAARAELERDHGDWTHLHAAARNDNPAVLEVLLAAGADPNARTVRPNPVPHHNHRRDAPALGSPQHKPHRSRGPGRRRAEYRGAGRRPRDAPAPGSPVRRQPSGDRGLADGRGECQRSEHSWRDTLGHRATAPRATQGGDRAPSRGRGQGLREALIADPPLLPFRLLQFPRRSSNASHRVRQGPGRNEPLAAQQPGCQDARPQSGPGC